MTPKQQEAFWKIFNYCLENNGTLRLAGNRSGFGRSSLVTANMVGSLAKEGYVDVATISVSTWQHSENRVSPTIDGWKRRYAPSVYTDIRISEKGHKWTRGEE